ncbi:MAG TPA: helix-turn-helix transcriptional regulator [Micromonosporaceae bacterium]|jgi:transcriptional regulator with XRE-family HTH domain|nr:helix-turn-helix transcriptional regulator [Micromonosporaceae bacterium]
MSNVDSPAVARRRVRLALRAAREEKQLTQGQVAEAMGWSISKVIRIEKGEVNVSPGDLTVLLEHLGITDKKTVAELAESARVSRRERWTVSAEEREFYTPAMIELVQFEAEALTVRYYNNVLVPGPLQVRPYAEAVLARPPTPVPSGAREARIRLREQRRERLYAPNGPAYLVLLDESVLYREVGSARIMAEQLEFLRSIVVDAGARLQLRIIPFSAQNTKYNVAPYVLVDLDQGRSALLYRETAATDEIVDAEADVQAHRLIFDSMWASSSDREQSLEIIERRTASIRPSAGA